MEGNVSEMHPSVTVVIPAHKRIVELRRAINAVMWQEYQGDLDVIVVYDRAEPDMSLEKDGDRPVRVLTNERTPGLAGARNTGILASTGDFIAFCDDDDYWHPRKLATQIAEFEKNPEAPLVTTAIMVDYEDKSKVRLAGTDRVTYEMLLKSRMSMLHSSTLLFRREALLGPLGLIDEEIPGSQNEDWDILLRAASLHPIVHIDQPYVRVMWGKGSHFSRRWDTKIDSSIYMLENYPDVAADKIGSSRLQGQIAFSHAASGNRDEAWQWAGRAIKQNPMQWRAWLAYGVALAPMSSEPLLNGLNRWGRGV